MVGSALGFSASSFRLQAPLHRSEVPLYRFISSRRQCVFLMGAFSKTPAQVVSLGVLVAFTSTTSPSGLMLTLKSPLCSSYGCFQMQEASASSLFGVRCGVPVSTTLS